MGALDTKQGNRHKSPAAAEFCFIISMACSPSSGVNSAQTLNITLLLYSKLIIVSSSNFYPIRI
jgi:hypothetical protein